MRDPIPEDWGRWLCGGSVAALCRRRPPPDVDKAVRTSRRGASLTWSYMLSHIRLEWLHMPCTRGDSQMSPRPLHHRPSGRPAASQPVGMRGKELNSASSLSSGVGQRGVLCSDGASGAPDVTAGRRSHYPRVSPRSVCESVYPPGGQMAKRQNLGPLAARSGHSTTPKGCQIVNLMMVADPTSGNLKFDGPGRP